MCDSCRVTVRPASALGALAQRALVDALGEPVGDDLGQELGGGVDAGEVGFVVEVAVVQLADDGAEFLGGQSDVDDDVVLVQLLAPEGGVHQERRSVQALRGSEDVAAEAVGDHDVIADGDAEQRTTLQVRRVCSPAVACRGCRVVRLFAFPCSAVLYVFSQVRRSCWSPDGTNRQPMRQSLSSYRTRWHSAGSSPEASFGSTSGSSSKADLAGDEGVESRVGEQVEGEGEPVGVGAVGAAGRGDGADLAAADGEPPGVEGLAERQADLPVAVPAQFEDGALRR